MKIAYLLEVNPYKNSGIVKKINDQVAFWKQRGHQVEVFNIWPKPKENKPSFFNFKTHHHKILDSLIPDGFVKNYTTKIFCANKVSRAIKRYNPDILYHRQNIWYPGLISILKQYASIMELNTVDTFEMKFYSKLKSKIYFYGKKKILNNTNALVAVSPSILEHYKDFNRPKIVVSNGINLTAIKPKKENNQSNETNLVFVGSNNMEWHGLDKIFQLATSLPKVTFHIVGYQPGDYPNVKNKNVIFYGWMDKEQLTSLYATCHFGIGSFGNHLVGKPIDSTLKVREYLAYGLPVILGHIDVDFKNSDFVKKVTNQKHELISILDITQFLIEHKDTIIKKDMITIITSNTKENERLLFFHQTAHNGK